jgi:hypothetical protein
MGVKMLKKICFLIFLGILFVSFYNVKPAFDKNLSYILTQINAVKRSWNEARVKIKLSQKASFEMYQKVSPIFENIIASADFINKMHQKVDEQVDAIVNQYMSFSSVKANISLSDFYPSLVMHDFGRNLFAAMAQKAYCYLLGQKLVDKVKMLQEQERVKESF